MTDLLKNYPPGPLDHYRSKASFDWKKMKCVLYSDEAIRFQNRLYNTLKSNPELLEQSLITPNLEELQEIGVKKMYILKSIENEYMEELMTNMEKQFVFISISAATDLGITVKKITGFELFSNMIKSIGTERHKDVLNKMQNLEIIGCYGLTEVGHGSDSKSMQTTATYDVATQQFIINTPNFQAAKCWISSLGRTATHMVLFAKLLTPDGIDHGLHAFIVQVRDTKTFQPYPGIKIINMTEKIGLNSIDNGVIIFNNYGIPRENLLNKVADITEDGKYITKIHNPVERFVYTLAGLVINRLHVASASVSLLCKAVTIAVRYAGIRKQFSAKTKGEDTPILEYQIHQYRLLPYLANVYAFNIFFSNMYKSFSNYEEVSAKSSKSNPIALAEFHAIFSACKSLCVWVSRDGIQECREACGGHGYLKAAEIGDLRNGNDAMLTGEGDNHVLIQQTSKWLLKIWSLRLKNFSVSTPLNSVEFLNDFTNILISKCSSMSVEEVKSPKYILHTYKWLVCYLLKSSLKESNEEVNQIVLENLAVSYLQHLILHVMFNKIQTVPDAKIKAVLLKLFLLYGTYNLFKHVPTLYAGGYASTPNTTDLIQKATHQLCSELKNEAVALVDAVAVDDCIMKSFLGHSDGQVYKRLERVLLEGNNSLSEPDFSQKILRWRNAFKNKI